MVRAQVILTGPPQGRGECLFDGVLLQSDQFPSVTFAFDLEPFDRDSPVPAQAALVGQRPTTQRLPIWIDWAPVSVVDPEPFPTDADTIVANDFRSVTGV